MGTKWTYIFTLYLVVFSQYLAQQNIIEKIIFFKRIMVKVDSTALIWIQFMLPRKILMGGGEEAYPLNVDSFHFLPFPYRDTVGESGKKWYLGKGKYWPLQFLPVMTCVLLVLYKARFQDINSIALFLQWGLFFERHWSKTQHQSFSWKKVHILGLIDPTNKSVEEL